MPTVVQLAFLLGKHTRALSLLSKWGAILVEPVMPFNQGILGNIAIRDSYTEFGDAFQHVLENVLFLLQN